MRFNEETLVGHLLLEAMRKDTNFRARSSPWIYALTEINFSFPKLETALDEDVRIHPKQMMKIQRVWLHRFFLTAE